FTREEILDLFEMCSIFEGHAIATGASRMTRAELLGLDHCVKRIVEARSVVDLLKADGAFHMGLMSGVRNKTIQQRIEDFHAYFRMYYHAMPQSELPRPVETYRIVVSDLRNGNILAASARIEVHLLDQGRKVAALGDK